MMIEFEWFIIDGLVFAIYLDISSPIVSLATARAAFVSWNLETIVIHGHKLIMTYKIS